MPNIFGIIPSESFIKGSRLCEDSEEYNKFSFLERASVAEALKDLSRDLRDCSGLFKIDLKQNTIVFSKNFAPAYFRAQYKEFVREVTREDFFENFCYTHKDPFFVVRLQQLLEKQTWHYVDDAEVGLQTFDEFVRNIEPDKPYKVFDCLYYHD